MFKQDSVIHALKSKPIKLVDHFKYLGSNILSTKSEDNIRIAKAGTASDS